MLVTLRSLKMKSRLRTVEGFTLVEVLVAVAIFSLALLGLAAGTLSVAQTNNNSHLNAAAVNLSQEKLEQFSSMSSSAFASVTCPTFTTTGCSDTPTASNQNFNRSWRVTANSPTTAVATVEVKVDWTDYTSHTLTFAASLPQ